MRSRFVVTLVLALVTLLTIATTVLAGEGKPT
jgi:hypothetical protein